MDASKVVPSYQKEWRKKIVAASVRVRNQIKHNITYSFLQNKTVLFTLAFYEFIHKIQIQIIQIILFSISTYIMPIAYNNKYTVVRTKKHRKGEVYRGAYKIYANEL